MGLSPKSNYEKKSFLVLTSGKFLETLGRGIGTGSIFCFSFSLSNRVMGSTPGYFLKSFLLYKKNSLKQSLVKIRILLQKGFQFIACSLIYGFFECFECAIHFTLSTKGVLFCPYCLPFFDWSFSQWCQQKTTLVQQFGTLIVFTNLYLLIFGPWCCVWVCSPVEYLLEFDLLCT